ncbi:hypothetical protein ACH9EU_03955 [Kocuria sp. M1R5S2]|uniref:hypothetical protein n=1 Tax=Kocuria rhizosphaerae TaxID=3376285 RepID=UPI0037A0EF04
MPRPGRHGDASGPLLAWCGGTRCTALHRLTGGEDRTGRISSTIRGTRGSVLITSPCLGRCHLACVAAVARRDGSSGRIGPMAWLSGLEDDARFDALRHWIAAGGPQELDRPDHAVPAALRDAVCGIGPPPRLHEG